LPPCLVPGTGHGFAARKVPANREATDRFQP
jgi:hypothetical protein